MLPKCSTVGMTDNETLCTQLAKLEIPGAHTDGRSVIVERAGVNQYKRLTRWRNCLVIDALADGRTTMKHFVLSIALSALVAVAMSATAQAAYYHHRTIITGIMAVAAPTGIIIGPSGRGEVTTRSQLVSSDLPAPILLRASSSAPRALGLATSPY